MTLAPQKIEIDVAGPDPERSPMAARFFRSWPMPCPAITGIIGPTGSGKTGTLFRKLWRLAQRMPISPIDGMRHFKCVSLAGTYRQNWRGPIPSYLKILPKELGDWHGSPPDSPASHEILARLEDGARLRYTHEFVAIGDRWGNEQELEEIFRGWEATVFHLVEMDTLPPVAMDFALNRSGRYPDTKHGAPPWYGAVFDMNAPRQTSWVYHRIRETWREGEQFFVQPPAILRDGAGGWTVNPRAENTENLPEGYYDGQVRTLTPQFIRRFLAGEHMPDVRGKPVYGFFTDAKGATYGCFDAQRHVAKRPLAAQPGLDLYFGTDGGLQPGGWFFQVDPSNGQVRVLAEILAEHNTQIKRYADQVKFKLANPPLDGKFKAATVLGGADPSCFFGKDAKTGDGDWADEFERITKIILRPGGEYANKLLPRIEVLTNLLAAPDVAPGVPKFLIDPRCVISIEALEGGYRYRQKLINAEEPQYDPEPEKNHFSHLIEGGQYGLLRALGPGGAWGRGAADRQRSQARAAITQNNEGGDTYARPRREASDSMRDR